MIFIMNKNNFKVNKIVKEKEKVNNQNKLILMMNNDI